MPHRYPYPFVAVLAFAACGEPADNRKDDPNLYAVAREDLPITVKEAGELQAVRETIVRSEVEGQATIIYLIPEGTAVQAGDKLVELDVSELVEKRANQEISVEKAKSALEQAKTQREILESELLTRLNTAVSQLRIAQMQLEKLLGARGGKGSEGRNEDMVRRLHELVTPEPEAAATTTVAEVAEAVPAAIGSSGEIVHVDPGNYAGLVDKVIELLTVGEEGDPLQRDMGEMANRILQQADQIRLAMADLKVKEDTVSHSRRLAAKQFITRSELERDELAFQSQASKVTIAWNDLELLINYTLQTEKIQLQQDYENAKLELKRVEASNDAERKKSQFDVDAKQKEYQVAKERLDNLVRQVGNAVCYAPTPGLVVYARVDRNRRGGDAIAEGTQVRERQELILLPDNTQMRCLVKVQEAQVDMVMPGQPAHIQVEAFPTEVLTGRVTRVAPVADSSNSWMGNDKKVYTTVIDLDGVNHDQRLRSRMAAAATITVKTIQDVLTVPLQAVRRDRSVNYVWKRTPEGPLAVRVLIGAHNQEKAQVLEGLQEGEIVYRTPPGGQPDPKFDQPALPEVPPADQAPVALPQGGTPVPSGDSIPVTRPGEERGAEARGEGERAPGGARGRTMMKPYAEMSADELTEAKASLPAMVDRFRSMLDDEQAAKLDKVVGDIGKALDENRLDDAQTLRNSLREFMPRRRPRTDGDSAPRGGN